MQHGGEEGAGPVEQLVVVVVDGVFFGLLLVLLPLSGGQGQGHVDGEEADEEQDPLAVHGEGERVSVQPERRGGIEMRRAM